MLPDDVRRSGRISKEIAILLIGSDMEGRVFSEETKTVVLSRHGAGVISEQKLFPEQELILRCPETNKEAEVRVVGQIGAQGDKYTYGVSFLNTDLDFWGIKFPPSSFSGTPAVRLSLECSSCKTRETLDEGDLASDVCAINEGVVRYCKQCGFSTLWNQPREVMADSPIPAAGEKKTEPILSETQAPPEEKTPFPPVNRRKHVRAKVNCKACIRSASHKEDIVDCEDMSRGGLRFKSKKRYFEKSFIEVAVPYSRGDPGLFVPARIVYVLALEEQKLFRCGVEYLGSKGHD